MSDLQNDVSKVQTDVTQSAVHAENRFLAMLKDNAVYVAAVAGAALLILMAFVFWR